MAAGKSKASTLPTRTRTLPKTKTNGARKQIAKDPPPEEPEDAQDPEDDENDAGGDDDDDLDGVGQNSDEGDAADGDEAEPLAASEAEEAPPEEAPVAGGRRGRPKGPRKTASAKPTGDIYGALVEAGLMVKHIADAHGRTPQQILTAVGNIMAAVSELDA